MNISSRTPEGQPNVCPVCGKHVQIEPSSPAGDAPCPHCGSLLWFVATDAGLLFFEKAALYGYQVVAPRAAPPDRDRSDRSRSDTDICPGDRVRVVEGTFEHYEGEFIGVNPRTGRAMLSINIFGRDTPLELPLSFLERA
jgi:hypothetical protein